MATHRYWRVRNTDNIALSGQLACAKLELRDTIGGTDRASGMNGIADSTQAAPPITQPFDANASTFWASGVSTPGNNHWLGVDFGGTPWDIAEFAWSSRNDSFRQDPIKLSLEYSDDGTNWTEKFHTNDLTAWTSGETRVFNASNSTITPFIRNTESYALVAQNFPTPSLRTSQIEGLVIGVPATPIRTTEAYALVAILTGGEDRMLRAWQFTQDDHDFYVVLASNETYIYDKLSEQWCQWKSPDAAYWRGVDGSDWEGINVCIDPDNGKLYQIDPINRLDYNTTPITSEIYGGMTERFRKMTPCYMAEVAVSQADPPFGIDASTVGIKLETYDTINWVNHGTLTGQPSGAKMTVRFYGLGLIQSPGVIFKITDTGYARRIDGLDVEMAGTPDGG